MLELPTTQKEWQDIPRIRPLPADSMLNAVALTSQVLETKIGKKSLVGTSGRVRCEVGDFIYPRFNHSSDGASNESQKGRVLEKHDYNLLVKSCRQ